MFAGDPLDVCGLGSASAVSPARPGESVIAAAPDAAVERLLRLIEDSLPSLGRKQESNDS